MWLCRQSNNIFLLCGLLLSAGLVLQLKVLYNNHVKHMLLEEIKFRMSELDEEIDTVSRVANRTSILLKKLATVGTSTVRHTMGLGT